MDCNTLSFLPRLYFISLSLLKFMSIELMIQSNHLIVYHPLLLLPSIFPSIWVFYNKSTLCITWTKYWSFSFSITPSSEYSGLISFSRDWLDLLAVQGTLKSFLQHHSSKASINPWLFHFSVWQNSLQLKKKKIQHSAFFRAELTSIHDHWKNHSID